jgi:hypothetical protein
MKIEEVFKFFGGQRRTEKKALGQLTVFFFEEG